MQDGRLGPKPRTRKMIGMISVILAAIALIMVGYLAVGFAGYLAFPRTVSSNVLKTFPDTAIMQVCRTVARIPCTSLCTPSVCVCSACLCLLADSTMVRT
jgi:amino acid permease